MIKLKTLITESLIVPLTDEQLEQYKNLILTHCPNNWAVIVEQRNPVLFRGRSNSDSPMIVDPIRTTTRSATSTQNYVNLMVSEILLSWKGWPSRNKSIITSSSSATARTYAKNQDIFAVIPFDGSKLAQSPASDFWVCFDHGAHTDIPTINSEIFRATELVTSDDIQHSKDKFLEALKQLEIKMSSSNSEDIRKFSGVAHIFQERGVDVRSLIDGYDYILDPTRNGFKLFDSLKNIDYDKEVWTEGKCIFIHMDQWVRFFNWMTKA